MNSLLSLGACTVSSGKATGSTITRTMPSPSRPGKSTARRAASEGLSRRAGSPEPADSGLKLETHSRGFGAVRARLATAS